MPLTGSGAAMGALILAAIGNPDPAAIPAFATLGDTIGAWAIANVNCLPGDMTSAGTVVTGAGVLSTVGAYADLGVQLATAMHDPSPGGIATWTAFARALTSHFDTFGTVDPTNFVAPSPGPGPLTGTGAIAFTSLVFAPLLSSQLGVSDPAAAAMLEVFGAQILAHIQTNAQVLPTSTLPPYVPYTSPSGGGAITGAGAIL